MGERFVLSFSGGKDSTAAYLWLLEKGYDFIAVFADVGHEHPWTYEFIGQLPQKTGGPAIETVRADLSDLFARRPAVILETYPLERQAAAIEAISKSTGIPFLDLCLLKGMFPANRRRWCTQYLKQHPIMEQVILPILDSGAEVVSVQAVRAEESAPRAKLPILEDRGGGFGSGAHSWTGRLGKFGRSTGATA